MSDISSTLLGPRLLSTRELARVFGVSEAAIRKRIRLGQLGPAVRIGKGYIIREEALVAFLKEKEAAAVAERA